MAARQPEASWDARNALFLPDITHIIAEHVSHRDRYNLAMTCNALFHLVVPLLWSTVWGVEQLLCLIPGTLVTKEQVEERKKVTIIISELALTEPWHRFWAYAPFVKGLLVHGSRLRNKANLTTLHGWNILFTKRKEFENSLLPQLEWLGLHSPKPPDMAFDPIYQLAWFTLFLSPSLKMLDLRDCPALDHDRDSDPNSPSFEFPSPSALLLLNSLAKSLPRAHEITLSPYFESPTKQMIALSNSGIQEECLGWFNHLPSLVNLTHLAIYNCAVSGESGQGLIVLGHLPYLKRLDVIGASGSRCDFNTFFEEDPPLIPSGLFPSLKYLRLSAIQEIQLFRFMWNSIAIVSKLTEARIDFTSRRPISWDELISQIIPRLCNNSPNLKYLNILTILRFEDFNRVSLYDLKLIFEALSRLPLLTLRIQVGSLISDSLPPHAPPTLSPLESLDIMDPLNRYKLRACAAWFPNLWHISIILETEIFEEEFSSQLYQPASLQPVVVHVRFQGPFFVLDSPEVLQYARDNLPKITQFFKSLWPNLSNLDTKDGACKPSCKGFKLA